MWLFLVVSYRQNKLKYDNICVKIGGKMNLKKNKDEDLINLYKEISNFIQEMEKDKINKEEE